VDSIDHNARNGRHEPILVEVCAILVAASILVAGLMLMHPRTGLAERPALSSDPRGNSGDRLPGPGQSTAVALGGSVSWSFTVSMSGWVSGNATIQSGKGVVTVELLNSSNWAHLAASLNNSVNNWTIAGPGGLLGTGGVSFGFGFSPGTWYLVLLYPNYPGGPCGGGCASAGPIVLVWVQGIVVYSSGSQAAA